MNLQKFIRGFGIFLIFLIPFFALIVVNSYFFPFITGKAFYFRVLVELVFACFLILAFLDPRYRPKFTLLTYAVSLFALVTLVADLLGVNPVRSMWSNFERMEGWITIIHLWAFYIATSAIFGSDGEGKRWWHRFFNMSLLVSAIVAIYGIVQLSGHAVIHQGGARIDASLGNAEYMAVYMLLHAFIAAYLFFVARRGEIAGSSFLQVLYAIGAVVFGFLVVATQTRGTTLGLAGGIILALAIYAFIGRNESVTWRKISAGVILLIVLLGGALWLSRNTTFVRSHETLNRLANISWKDTSTQARAYIWPMALQGVQARPLFGWGQENYNYIFNATYNPKMWSQEQWFDRAHNVFLDWLVAAGVLGLIVYLSFYALSLRGIWKSEGLLTFAEKCLLTGLIAAYFVHNIFVFDNIASYILFFSVLAFANSISSGRSIKWLGDKEIGLEVVEYVIAPIAIILLVGVVYFFNYRPIKANTRLIVAITACGSGQPDPALYTNALDVNTYVANQEIREQVWQCSAATLNNARYPQDLKQSMLMLTGNTIQDQIKATPKDARAYMLGGSLMNNIGQFGIAQSLLTTAHALSPGKQTISFELATSYINNGLNAEALALLKKAYESATNYAQAAQAYAVALILNGQGATAEKLFAGRTEILENSRTAQAYSSAKQYSKAIAIFTKLATAEPGDLTSTVGLAQAQYASGDITSAIATMRNIVEKNHPELKDQIEASIANLKK